MLNSKKSTSINMETLKNTTQAGSPVQANKTDVLSVESMTQNGLGIQAPYQQSHAHQADYHLTLPPPSHPRLPSH